MRKAFWEYIPIVGHIRRNILNSRERDKLIVLSVPQEFDLDKIEYEIPREFLPEPIRAERRKIAEFVGGMEVNIFDNRTIAERIAAMDQRELAYFRSLYISDAKIVGLFLDQAGYPIPDEFQPEVVASNVDDRGPAFDDESAMTPFTLADLGLSEEEIADLNGTPWPPAPRVARQLSAADLARLQNMDSTQLQAAHALDLTDAEILELGLDRLFPLGIRSESRAIFSLADLGLTFTEIYEANGGQDLEEVYLADAIRNGILDRQALDYIRRHPEIVPAPASEKPKRWLPELPVSLNVFLNHIRFETWLRAKRNAQSSRLSVLTLIGNSNIHDLVREYLDALDEARRSEQAWAYYPARTLDEVPSEVAVRAEWAHDLRAEAERLLALCEAALQVEAGVYRRREVYTIFGAEYEGACLCGPRLELEAIARQIQAAGQDDARYSEALKGAYTSRQNAEMALTQLNVRLVPKGTPVLNRYRFLLVGSYDLSVFVDAQNPRDAISNLREEKVVSGETPQAKRRARQQGRRGWCEWGYDAFMEGLDLVTLDGPMHSEGYSSTLIMRELPYAEGPMQQYRFIINGYGESFSCLITASSFYLALDQILEGKRQLSLEGEGLRAGGLFDVFNFNTMPSVLAKLATLTPQNRMANFDGYRIRWSLV